MRTAKTVIARNLNELARVLNLSPAQKRKIEMRSAQIARRAGTSQFQLAPANSAVRPQTRRRHRR